MPQKLTVRHTSRQFYANGIQEFNDSGYLIIPEDRRLYESQVFSINNSLDNTCHDDFEKEKEFCRMPIIHPEEFNMGFHYIEGSPPAIEYKLKIHLEENNQVGLRKYYKFVVEGPHVILINIIPSWNSKLVEWNLSPQIDEIDEIDFKPPYIVHLTYADTKVNHTLELYFTVS